MARKLRAVIGMGAAGCGKTTVGKALAEKLGCPYLEAGRRQALLSGAAARERPNSLR